MGPGGFGSGVAPREDSCVRGELEPPRMSSNRRLRVSRLALVLLTDVLMSSLGRFSFGVKDTRSANDFGGCPFDLQGGSGEVASMSVDSSVDLRLRGTSG